MAAKIWLIILILPVACYLLFYMYVRANVSPKPQSRLSFEKDIHSLTGSDSSSLSNVQRQAISNENNSFVTSSGKLPGSFNGTSSRLVLIYTKFFGRSGWAGQEEIGRASCRERV